ncbi:O-antigen ligase domain-containing protein [Brumimicrobium glaciale]|uniref:O-antigen ligase domain-containing protein n=1 Tax=Brumimicrobium glaciale TaxID=200475 RepID=A0A4Q4KM64_9FLAO|nr:O-antigen ligase family protein [Brumimicrobium glaciale]RYM33464.1 O-antigen ligase domain-containing protein [Brumimicrobium glaciale]
MIILKLINHILFFSTFFCILYFETYEIAGVKFAIIWKAPVLLFMALRTLKGYRIIHNTNYLKYGYLLTFKMLFSISGLSSIIITVNSMIRFVVFPLIIHYFHLFISNKKAIYYLKTFSTYIILSTIPFILKLIKPLKSGYDLSKYGIDGDGFIGVFQKPHSASIILSIALIIIFFFLKQETKKSVKIFFIILICIGTIALIQTYVRTGWAMFLVGLGILFLQKKSLIYYIKLTPIIVIIGFSAFVFYQNNEGIQMRFQEKNIYQEESTSISVENIGSGRFMIAFYALENWWDEGVISIFFGLGEELAREKMLSNKGSAIFAHNGFIEILQTEGLIGFIIFMLFYIGIYKAIKKGKKHYYYKLSLVIFMMLMAATFLQGGDNYVVYCLLALSLSLLSNSNRKLGRKQTAYSYQSLKH